VVFAQIARDPAVAARDLQIDSDDLLGDGTPTMDIGHPAVRQIRSGRVSGGTEHDRGPPLLRDESLSRVIGLMKQRDPKVLTRRSGAVCLDNRVEQFIGHDRPVEQ
jgi:hypothetical protein